MYAAPEAPPQIVHRIGPHCAAQAFRLRGITLDCPCPACLRYLPRRESLTSVERGAGGQAGPPKVRCGPATLLQPRPPSHGLHRLLSSMRVRLASECSTGSLFTSILGLGTRQGLRGSGLYRRVTPVYFLSLVVAYMDKGEGGQGCIGREGAFAFSSRGR